MAHVSSSADPVIARMVEMLVGRFRPVRLVLFGSRARGDFRADSDYDLLVELDTSAGDRYSDIIAALRQAGIDASIVTSTPEDYERRKDDVGTIEYQVQRDGKVLYERENRQVLLQSLRPSRVREERRRHPKSVARWREKGETDLASARELSASGSGAWSTIAFLSHEGAEKLLKAAVITTRTPPPRTHSLAELLALAPVGMRTDPALLRACIVLDDAYGPSRYPDLGPNTTSEVAQQCLEAAELLRTRMLAVIGPEE